MKFPFGKYSDWEVCEVPDEYLEWFIRSNKSLLEAVEKEVAARAAAKNISSSLAQQIIETGYRILAKQMHPDSGGTNKQMAELNATIQVLRNRL